MTAQIIPFPEPKRGAKMVKAEFQQMLREASVNGWQPRCYRQPELYADWLKAPSAEDAAELCAGCPLFDLCGEEARLTRPAWGIRAGVAWVYGVPQTERIARQKELRAAKRQKAA